MAQCLADGKAYSAEILKDETVRDVEVACGQVSPKDHA